MVFIISAGFFGIREALARRLRWSAYSQSKQTHTDFQRQGRVLDKKDSRYPRREGMVSRG
jgi:hypothetical protein